MLCEKSKEKTENIHAEHRKRMRERFIKTKGEGYSDHELLETLLYYSIPRIDTNDIAHRLLNRFSNFAGVFSASIEELCLVENIGQVSAIHLKLIFSIFQRMLMEDMPEFYKTYEEIGELFVQKLRFVQEETMLLVLFDKRGRICREVVVAAGDCDGAAVDMKKVISSAVCREAYYAAVAHNHPSGILKHSFDDEYVTVNIREMLSQLGIKLVDHYIVADGRYSGILNSGFNELKT